mmetsp:Transcript_61907/g.182862  ORF Transcript_61907/g.182862 Transcript_61907/m.182862 type:complete len:398 (+) Transcript_61907:1354-2547(+)
MLFFISNIVDDQPRRGCGNIVHVQVVEVEVEVEIQVEVDVILLDTAGAPGAVIPRGWLSQGPTQDEFRRFFQVVLYDGTIRLVERGGRGLSAWRHPHRSPRRGGRLERRRIFTVITTDDELDRFISLDQGDLVVLGEGVKLWLLELQPLVCRQAIAIAHRHGAGILIEVAVIHVHVPRSVEPVKSIIPAVGSGEVLPLQPLLLHSRGGGRRGVPLGERAVRLASRNAKLRRSGTRAVVESRRGAGAPRPGRLSSARTPLPLRRQLCLRRDPPAFEVPGVLLGVARSSPRDRVRAVPLVGVAPVGTDESASGTAAADVAIVAAVQHPAGARDGPALPPRGTWTGSSAWGRSGDLSRATRAIATTPGISRRCTAGGSCRRVDAATPAIAILTRRGGLLE